MEDCEVSNGSVSSAMELCSEDSGSVTSRLVQNQDLDIVDDEVGSK